MVCGRGSRIIYSADESRRPWLLEELLRVEWELRGREGDSPLLEEYLGRFPDYREVITVVFDGSPAAADRSRELGPSGMLTQAAARDQGSPQPLPPALANHPDYQIVRELGRGGMGVVYLAHNRLMARDEVLKVMGRHIVEQPGVMDRFLNEIRAVARLRHPNIVSAYTAFRCGEDLVFAMEYVAGLNLAQVVHAKGPSAIRQACSYIYQAALGLQYAHEEGMVHRDIKPANLMLSHQRDRAMIKLLDFGLSKAASEQNACEVGIAMAIDTYDLGAHLTCTGDMLGTPDFIAPEQIADPRQADIRADIYSLGCTLYYLLSGRAPFPNLNLRDVLKAHRSLHPRPLDEVRAEVPADLSAIVVRMMAKEPDRRFKAPSEVALALAPFFKRAAVASVSAGPGSGPERTSAEDRNGSEMARPGPDAVAGDSKPARGRPRWVWTAAAAGSLVLVLTTVWASGIFRVRPAEKGIDIPGNTAKKDTGDLAGVEVGKKVTGRTRSPEQPVSRGGSAPGERCFAGKREPYRHSVPGAVGAGESGFAGQEARHRLSGPGVEITPPTGRVGAEEGGFAGQ